MKKLFCVLALFLALTCAFAACDYAPDNTPPDKDGISLLKISPTQTASI